MTLMLRQVADRQHGVVRGELDDEHGGWCIVVKNHIIEPLQMAATRVGGSDI